MDTGIVVITHNGKMPADGGIRIGYQIGNKVFLLGAPAGVIVVQPMPLKPMPAVLSPFGVPKTYNRIGVLCENCGFRNGSPNHPLLFGINQCFNCGDHFEVVQLSGTQR